MLDQSCFNLLPNIVTETLDLLTQSSASIVDYDILDELNNVGMTLTGTEDNKIRR